LGLFAPTRINNVWIITFEYSGIASLGGLGEAVRARAEMLARRGKEVTVFMPSHGRYMDPVIRARLGLRDRGFSECGYRRGVDGAYYHYCLGAEEATISGVSVVLFKGLDRATRIVMDSWDIYSYAEEKASLLARALRAYAQRSSELPDIVDANDWHSVMAGISVGQEAERRGLALPLLYSIHLSTSRSFPWHYASSEWSGISNGPHLVWRVYRHEVDHYIRVWESVGGDVEAFGVYEADAVSTVSHSYLWEEIARKYGGWVIQKSCVVYNPTWLRRVDAIRWISEKYRDIQAGVEWKIIEDHLGGYRRWGYLDGRGFLMVALGRLTWQKGFDIAVRALDMAPHARLLILGIGVGDLGFEDSLRRLVEERWGRAMVIPDRVPIDVRNAIVAMAKSTVIPSRWEPFGLVAVESMALGTPVIASSVGGLREIVVDLRGDAGGNGLLARPEDPWDLGLAMESMAILMGGGDPSQIPLGELRRYAEKGFENRLRARCVEHVDQRFREDAAYSQLEACYEKARQMAYYRAVASGNT